jgi:hypothetical protein
MYCCHGKYVSLIGSWRVFAALTQYYAAPDGSGVLGMMPGHAAKLDVMGIKVITVFHANR